MPVARLTIDDTNVVQTKLVSCQATTAVNDFVYVDTANSNTVIEATSDNPPEPIVGIVREKLTAQSCIILLVGLHPITLEEGTIYLGTDGKSTLVPPVPGTWQQLGYSFGDGNIFFNPNLLRSKRL